MAAATLPARQSALDVLRLETQAFRDLVAGLSGPDWDSWTDSAGWRVRDVVAHVAGQYEELARPGTFLRRLRRARRQYPERIVLDGHNQVQIDELAGTDLVAHLDRYVPAALTALRRMPGLVRRLPSRLFFPEPPLPEPSLCYLFDVLTARDTWMHRLEVARATDRAFVLGSHDADVTARVVVDLAAAWTGPAMLLKLTGPAGGEWTVGAGAVRADGVTVQADGVAAMLHLSGRVPLAEPGPLADARVVF